MTQFVVDSSAFSALLFAEPDGLEIASRLEGGRLLAPSLLILELANVALKKCNLGLLTPEQVTSSFIRFHRFNVELHEVDMDACFATALRHRLTAYDASYLLLSRNTGAELVTLDRKLARAASDA